MARVLVDTSAVYALLDRNDRRHVAAKGALRALALGHVEPLLTNFVVAECHALALSRLGHSYTDATSFAVMERLGLRRVFAFDPNFQQYGFQVVGPS